jgi:HAMP domain-containing protein
MNALDRPVEVGHYEDDGSIEMAVNVKPSDVVAAHNAQTEDENDHLTRWGAMGVVKDVLATERDEARAEVQRLRGEVERLRDELRFELGIGPEQKMITSLDDEALGEQP